MEILVEISNALYKILYILIYVFIIFFISKSKLKKFISGVLITGISALIFEELLSILCFNLDLEIISDLFYYTSDGEPLLWFIPKFLYPFGNFLLITGFTFIIPMNYPHYETNKIELVGRKRSIGVTILLFVITLGVYFPFWLYRTVKGLEMNYDSEVPYSPGKAVGFLFIPIFNIFWIIYLTISLPKIISKIEKKYFDPSFGFHFHPVLISILLLVIPLLSYLFYFSYIEESDIFSRIFAAQLFFYAASIYLWLLIQAKMNAFYDFNRNKSKLAE